MQISIVPFASESSAFVPFQRPVTPPSPSFILRANAQPFTPTLSLNGSPILEYEEEEPVKTSPLDLLPSAVYAEMQCPRGRHAHRILQLASKMKDFNEKKSMYSMWRQTEEARLSVLRTFASIEAFHYRSVRIETLTKLYRYLLSAPYLYCDWFNNDIRCKLESFHADSSSDDTLDALAFQLWKQLA